MMEKYDLQPEQTPYPFSWFSVDVKLGCLSVHLDEDNWHKCQVSEMATNIELMISSHIMDQGQTINYDIEEKQINLGLNLVLQELLSYHEEMNNSEMKMIQQALQDNYRDFKMIYTHYNDEVRQLLSAADSIARQQKQKNESSTTHRQTIANASK